MPTPPALTNEQRSIAFQRSLELRRDRAEIKHLLRTSQVRLSTLIQYDAAQGMKVIDLLMALPGVGKVGALKLLEAAGIPERNTVRMCGPRQTKALLGLFGW